jgi:hypothetical protein
MRGTEFGRFNQSFIQSTLRRSTLCVNSTTRHAMSQWQALMHLPVSSE